MNYLVSELFDLIEKEKDQAKKDKLLRDHNNTVVRTMLYLNYNPEVKFHLPEGAPPYKKETDKPIGYQQTTLNLEMRRFYIWCRPDESLTPTKREILFINMLEGLHYTEADLLCLIKDKKMEEKYPSISEEMVRRVLPDLLPPPQPKPEPEKKTRAKKSQSSTVTA